MKSKLKILIKNLPSIPVYCYLLLLALLSTSGFILLLGAISE